MCIALFEEEILKHRLVQSSLFTKVLLLEKILVELLVPSTVERVGDI